MVPRPLVSSEADAAGPAALGDGPAGLLEGVDRRLYPNDPSSSGVTASQGLVDGRRAPSRDPLADRARASTVTAGAGPGRGEAPPKASPRRSLWADLLQRVFEVAGQLRWPSPCESKIHRDAQCCPRCGGRMRVLAAITEAAVAQRILACLNLPTRAPPLVMSRPVGRTRAWPEHEAPSSAETDSLWSACEFDQSTPAEWDVGARRRLPGRRRRTHLAPSRPRRAPVCLAIGQRAHDQLSRRFARAAGATLALKSLRDGAWSPRPPA